MVTKEKIYMYLLFKILLAKFYSDNVVGPENIYRGKTSNYSLCYGINYYS